MLEELRTIRLLFDAGSETRRVTVDGVEYLVAPVVILVQGVIRGATSPAPELALASEFGAKPEVWNGTPITANGHPMRNGEFVTLTTGTATMAEFNETVQADILANEVVGELRGTRLDGDRLRAEAWINVERAKAIGAAGEAVLDRLQRHDTIEISAAYFAAHDENPGVYAGTHYAGVQRGPIIPDHFALLPDTQIGACSRQMGCGVRANTGENMASTPCHKDARLEAERLALMAGAELSFAVNVVSDEDLRTALQLALKAQSGDTVDDLYIWAVFPDRVVYRTYVWDNEEKAGLLQQGFTADEAGNVSLTGDAVAVRPLTDFVPVQNTDTATKPPIGEGDAMADDVKKKVDALIANTQTSWGESDRPWLSELCTERLDKLGPVVVMVEPQPAQAVPKTAADFLQAAPPDIAAVLSEGLELQRARKIELVQTLSANSRCKISKERLEAKEIRELEELVALAGEEISCHRPAPHINQAPEFPYMPDINWGGLKNAQ